MIEKVGVLIAIVVGLITIVTTTKDFSKKFEKWSKRRKIKKFVLKNRNKKISVVKLMKQFKVEKSVVEEVFGGLKKKYEIEYKQWIGGTFDSFFEDYYIVK